MTAQQELKHLLRLADLAWSRNRYEDQALVARRRPRAVLEMKRHLRELKRRGGPGLLGDLMKKHGYTQKEGLILLMLLRRRISSSDAYLSGQRILKRLNGGSYEILRDLYLLRPDGRLRSTQVVVPRDEEADPEDLLGTEFSLSAWAFRTLGRVVEHRRRRTKTVRPYRKSEDLLLDYLKLVSLLQKRANSLFEIEEWDEVVPPGEVPARHIQSQIDDHLETMRARQERSDQNPPLGPARFAEQLGLDEIEMQLVMALLFRELFQGETLTSAVELLKLVSRSKRDFLRNLGLFDDEGTLVSAGIIRLENSEESHVYAAEIGLESWVVRAIVDPAKRRSGFPRQTRQRFERYLRELRDSDTFFRDLNDPRKK